MDTAVCFVLTYPLDSDLCGEKRYPAFEQPGPVVLATLYLFLYEDWVLEGVATKFIRRHLFFNLYFARLCRTE